MNKNINKFGLGCFVVLAIIGIALMSNRNMLADNLENNKIRITTTTTLENTVLNEHLTSPIDYVIDEEKSIMVDLTSMKLYLINNHQIEKIIDVLYKGPSHLWFQSPTNYFKVGNKKELMRSKIVDVFMPNAVQIHEDFFIHGIPYYPNGERVTSKFSGGCLRIADSDAKYVYDFVNRGFSFIVYEQPISQKTLNSNFVLPIDENKYWIRQDFNSPLKLNGEYLQHSGVDMSTKNPEQVRAISDGKIAFIQLIGGDDAGFGNTVIVEHKIDNTIFYSMYAHLETIENRIRLGDEIKKGDVLGITGASGYNCQNYWRIGNDGCNESGFLDRHLHFEIKTKPVLTNSEGGDVCLRKNGELGPCYGYVPKNPLVYGYYNPITVLTKGINISNN